MIFIKLKAPATIKFVCKKHGMNFCAHCEEETKEFATDTILFVNSYNERHFSMVTDGGKMQAFFCLSPEKYEEIGTEVVATNTFVGE